MLCLYEARSMAKCPLTRGVRLWKVSISGGSNVILICKLEFIHVIYN